MKTFFKLVISIAVLTITTAHALAAPEPNGAVCSITGKVENIKTRIEKRPAELRKALEAEEDERYIDVYLNLSESSLLEAGDKDAPNASNCSIERLSKKAFQLPYGAKNIPQIGDTIRAKTQFSGDEFFIGQWLLELQVINKR